MIVRKTSRLTAPTLSLALLAGCAEQQADIPTSTDQFIRSALDAYGVIKVVPATAGPTPRAAPSITRPLTRADVCQGRFGLQSGYIDARTRQPIDCGPGV